MGVISAVPNQRASNVGGAVKGHLSKSDRSKKKKGKQKDGRSGRERCRVEERERTKVGEGRR